MNLILIFLYTFFSNGRFSRGVFLIYCLSIDISLVEFGFIQTCYSVSRLLMEVPSGFIADRFKRKNILVIGSLLGWIVSLGYIGGSLLDLTWRLGFLCFLGIIEGINFSLLSGTDQALLFEVLEEKQQHKRYLKYSTDLQILALTVLGIATAIGGWLAQESFLIIYLGQGLMYLLGGIAIFMVKEPRHNRKAKEDVFVRRQLQDIFSFLQTNKILWWLLLLIAVLELTLNLVTVFIQGYFQLLGLSTSIIGIILGGSLFVGVLGMYCAGKSSSLLFLKVRKGILLMLLPILIGFISRSASLAVGSFLLFTFLSDFISPILYDALQQRLPSEIRASILSMISLGSSLLALPLYPASGFLIEKFGYNGLFAALILCLLFVIFGVFFKSNIGKLFQE